MRVFIAHDEFLVAPGATREENEQLALKQRPTPSAQTTPAATNNSAITSAAIPLRDTTPQEAFQTFVDRLKAYDIAGASQLCDPDHKNTVVVTRIATNMQKASSDRDMDSGALASLVLQGIDEVTFEITEQTDDTAIAHITAPKDKTYELVRLDAGWRIRITDDKAPFPQQ